MRRSTHRKEVIRLGEAYRWEIDQAQAETRRVQAELDRLLDIKAELIHDHIGQRHALVIDCSDLAMHYNMPCDVGQRLTQRILITLMGLNKDHRPDLRAAEKRVLL